MGSPYYHAKVGPDEWVEMPRWITMAGVARLLNVDEKSIAMARDKGRINAWQDGRIWLIEVESAVFFFYMQDRILNGGKSPWD